MQVSILFFRMRTLIISVFIAYLLSACTSTNEVKPVKKQQKNTAEKQIPSVSKKTSSKPLQHIHPANPCTAAVSHTHSFEQEDHEHSYDCENTNKFIGNAHIHPATKTRKKFRHVHPNGAAKHNHH